MLQGREGGKERKEGGKEGSEEHLGREGGRKVLIGTTAVVYYNL